MVYLCSFTLHFEKQVKKDDLIFFVFMSNKIGYNCVFPP